MNDNRQKKKIAVKLIYFSPGSESQNLNQSQWYIASQQWNTTDMLIGLLTLVRRNGRQRVSNRCFKEILPYELTLLIPLGSAKFLYKINSLKLIYLFLLQKCSHCKNLRKTVFVTKVLHSHYNWISIAKRLIRYIVGIERASQRR